MFRLRKTVLLCTSKYRFFQNSFCLSLVCLHLCAERQDCILLSCKWSANYSNTFCGKPFTTALKVHGKQKLIPKANWRSTSHYLSGWQVHLPNFFDSTLSFGTRVFCFCFLFLVCFKCCMSSFQSKALKHLCFSHMLMNISAINCLHLLMRV